MKEDAMLEVHEITKEYNRRAVVDHVSFTIDRGEVLGYLGPNGSGKEHDGAHADRARWIRHRARCAMAGAGSART